MVTLGRPFLTQEEVNKRQYKYNCTICGMEYTVQGFNPIKCFYCGAIICGLCKRFYRIPWQYKFREAVRNACQKCQIASELKFIQEIPEIDLPVHMDWNWCTKQGSDAFLKRLGII